MTVLVLLPGMDGTGELFAPFEAQLRLPVLRLSYPLTPLLNYAQLVDHVRGQLPPGERFVLLGESFSGPVAMALAAQDLPGLAGLVLCCTFARSPHAWTRFLRPLTGLLPWPPPRFVAEGLLCDASTPAPVRALLADVLGRVPARTIRHRLQLVQAVDATAQLARVRVPVLYLRAAADRLVPRSAGDQVQAQAPRARLKTLAGPHLLLQTCACVAAREVEAFVRELEACDTAYPSPPREEAHPP